jgi:low temperature requirement protein LtrA
MADVSVSNEHPDSLSVAEPRVSTLELFFDLVFVFALTQVTSTLADDTTWTGLPHGILVFLVLWVCWDAYAWLTNALRAHRRAPRVVVLVAMTAMLAIATSTAAWATVAARPHLRWWLLGHLPRRVRGSGDAP